MTIPPFLIPIAAGLFAQALKPLMSRDWRRDQASRIDPRPRYGGMPSAHTAFATSIAATTAFVDGIHAMTFALAIAFLILVLDDALRLRVFLGRFGIAINLLIPSLSAEDRSRIPPIERRIGHTIPEVLAGAVVGLVVTIAIWLLDS